MVKEYSFLLLLIISLGCLCDFGYCVSQQKIIRLADDEFGWKETLVAEPQQLVVQQSVKDKNPKLQYPDDTSYQVFAVSLDWISLAKVVSLKFNNQTEQVDMMETTTQLFKNSLATAEILYPFGHRFANALLVYEGDLVWYFPGQYSVNNNLDTSRTVKDRINKSLLPTTSHQLRRSVGELLPSNTSVVPDDLQKKEYLVFDITPEIKYFPGSHQQESSASNQLNFIFVIYGKMIKTESTDAPAYLQLNFNTL